MDYTNEANIGLSQAIDKFDPNKGVKFASYALWFIKRAINDFNNDAMQVVKRTNYTKVFHVRAKAINNFAQENERDPTADELLEIMNNKYKKDIKDKNDLLDLRMTYVEDMGNDDDDVVNRADISAYNKLSASYNQYEATVNQDFNNEMIDSLIDILPPREKDVVLMRFGLKDNKGFRRVYETSEIADMLGVTAERVRQLEKAALKKMRKEYNTRIRGEI
jgi:RNA polymerase primary sigma factor